MRELNRIQKRNNLNVVYSVDEPHPVNKGRHHYRINWSVPTAALGVCEASMAIDFQNGPRLEPNSEHGILDTDLLEIVRDRLTAFQSGPYATRENAIALTHIEEALLWMNKRVEDRAAAGTLGTNKI
jgi:hypothetical protein